MKKIALFADVLEENFDGVSITLHKILRAAPEEQFEFLIITSHPPKNIENFPHKICLCSYLKVPFQKGYRLGLPYSKKVKASLNDFSPDLIHFTSPSLFGMFAIRYGKQHGIPVINIYHTHYPAYLKYYLGRVGDFIIGGLVKQLLMWYYRRSDLTLVPTRTIKKDLIKLGVPSDKMKVWGRAIKTGSFGPQYREQILFDLVIPKDHKKVLFVSRLIKEKEVKTVQKVYQLLQEADEKIALIITGDGPKRDWLEKKMPKAVFTGKKTGLDLAKIYASSDIFFFPSGTETFGNVVIEAMASGLPIVAADEGGPSELIRHKKTGFLVRTGKPKKFAKRILELVQDKELHEKMSNQAVRFISARSIDSLHEKLWQIYHRTIEEKQQRKKTVTDDPPVLLCYTPFLKKY